MDEVEIEHMYGEGNGCYYCDQVPQSTMGTGLFPVEQELASGAIRVLHLCRDCVAR